MKKIVFLVLSFLFSCQEKNKSAQVVEDFDEFYKAFNNDIDFQNSRIQYPLKGKKYSEDNLNSPGFEYSWTIADSLDWETLELDPKKFKTEKEYNADTVKVVITLANPYTIITSSFKPINGKWFLVRYVDFAEP